MICLHNHNITSQRKKLMFVQFHHLMHRHQISTVITTVFFSANIKDNSNKKEFDPRAHIACCIALFN